MYEGTSNNIKYAILDNDSGLLKTQTLFNDSVLGPMVLDSTGNPHLLYREEYPQHEFNNSTLYYAYWTGTTWKTQPIVSNIVLSGVGLALDKQDNPHIDYFIPSPGSVFYGSLIYETYTGKTWEIQTLNSNVTSGASMAIDSKGNPHLSYSGSHVYNSYNIAYCMYAMMTTSVTQVDVTSTLDFVLLIAILVIIAVFAFAVHICRKSSRSKNQIIQH
jgi:hypothetical protein